MNKEKSWYLGWLFIIIGGSMLGMAIHPAEITNYILALIGSFSLWYSGYNLGKVL